MALLQAKLASAVTDIEQWVESDISTKFLPGMHAQEERIAANEASTHHVSVLRRTCTICM